MDPARTRVYYSCAQNIRDAAARRVPPAGGAALRLRRGTRGLRKEAPAPGLTRARIIMINEAAIGAAEAEAADEARSRARFNAPLQAVYSDSDSNRHTECIIQISLLADAYRALPKSTLYGPFLWSRKIIIFIW